MHEGIELSNIIRLLSSRWETFPGWGHNQSHIWLNGFPPLRDTVHHRVSENWGWPNFYTPFRKTGKTKAREPSRADVRCRHLCNLTNQKESDCVILPCDSPARTTCRKANASKISAADTSAFHFSSRTGRFLHSLRTAYYELDMNGKPESRVSSVPGSAKWFCHPAGLIAGVEQSCTACVKGRRCRQAVAGRKQSFGFSTELIPYYLAWGIQSVIDPDINCKKYHSWFLSLSQINSINHLLSQIKQVWTTSYWDSLLGIIM